MSEITRGVIGMPFDLAMSSELSRRQFHQIAQALFAESERTACRLEVSEDTLEVIRACLRTAEAEIESLTKRAEAAELNARRYEFIRFNPNAALGRLMLAPRYPTADHIDAIFDNARLAEVGGE